MSLTIAKTKKIKGVSAAGTVALLQGMEGILFTVLGLFFVFDAVSSPEFSAAELALKETLCFVISILVFRKKAIGAFRALKHKKGLYMFASGTMTALGNLFYILGIAFAGASYGVILTALYPVFSMLLMRFLFKDKQSWKVWSGAAVAVAGGLLFVSLPAIFDKGEFNTHVILGMMFGLIAAFMWALEGMLIKKSIDRGGKNLHVHEQVLLRTFSTSLVTVAILMPFMALPCFHDSHHSSFYWFDKLITDYRTFLIVFATASAIIVLRYVHLYAIKAIGPKLTAIIDTNNFLVPAFFSLFLQFTNAHYYGSPDKILFDPIIWWSWFLLVPIFIGSFMVIYFERLDHDEDKPIVLDKNN